MYGLADRSHSEKYVLLALAKDFTDCVGNMTQFPKIILFKSHYFFFLC